MAEARQPSQQRQILNKLDEQAIMLNDINMKVSTLETRMNMQPLIDQETFKKMGDRINNNRNRIEKLEDSQQWLARSLILLAITTFVQIVVFLMKM